MRYFTAHYSDKETKNEKFKDRYAAVSHFMKDVFGHRLVSVIDYDSGEIVWNSKGQFNPRLPVSLETISETNAEKILYGMVKSADSIFATIEHKNSQTSGNQTGVDMKFKDGKITLYDSTGKPQKIFTVTIKEKKIQRHEFGKDFICIHCGADATEIDELDGVCQIDE